MIDQVGSAFRHPPATTTRAERAPLARERDETVQGAAVAAKSREPTRQEAAPEERPERPFDERRHPVPFAESAGLLEEGLQVILHNCVQHAAGGIPRFVARGRLGHPVHEADRVPTRKSTFSGGHW